MVDDFRAFDVGHGDAFLLRRGEFSAIVDGGLRQAKFPGRVAAVTGKQRIDVVVCTHNDGDHARGIADWFASKKAAKPAKQCWLPATWMEVLEQSLKAGPDFALEVLMGAVEGSDSEQAADSSANHEDGAKRDGISADRVDELLEKAADDEPLLDASLPTSSGGAGQVILMPGRKHVVLGGPWGNRATQALTMLDNIRKVAIAAIRDGTPISWFDPDQAPVGSANPHLSIVNAKLVTTVRRTALSPWRLVRLTTENRKALVLFSPGTDSAPPVLFCSDSGLGGHMTFPTDSVADMLVTAPHHGSEDQENIDAYLKLRQEFSQESPSWTWVRSDRRTKPGHPRPCGAYTLPGTTRYCTNCRAGGRGQDLVFHGTRGKWHPDPGLQACAC